ncbi:MAG: hypothetical protein OXE97_07585 [Gammaproteobacteria bacterium]|nr:hypothetical protein [Gammaproteobacteria bacterium]
MFEKEEASIELQPKGSGILRLEDVLQDQQYKKRGEELLKMRDEIISSVFSDKCLNVGDVCQIHVLLTGGSASLPIVRALAGGTDIAVGGISFRFSKITDIPGWINTWSRDDAQRITEYYPQCAVAIGGSVPELPEEIPLEDVVVSPASGTRQLDSYRDSP